MRGSAYSIVRYADPLNGQRLNIGVILFHPIDGFLSRFSDNKLSRLQAIDPRISIDDIKPQLDAIKEAVRASSQCATLDDLSLRFTAGVEVSAPYPTRVSGKGALDHLFETLVIPHHEVRQRTNYQRTFHDMVRHGLEGLMVHYPYARFEELPKHPVNGVSVDLGFLTEVGNAKALWRSLSLEPKEQKSTRLERSKSTAMELKLINETEFKRYKRIVMLQIPSHGDVTGIDESRKWIEHAEAEVLDVRDASDLDSTLRKKADSLFSHERA
jgi:hypothetical protein